MKSHNKKKKKRERESVTTINLTHEQVSGTWMLLPQQQSVFCTVADSLHRGSRLCVHVCVRVCVYVCVCVCGPLRPFECDEWAVDIEQRGWAGHGPGGWTKAVTVQKTQCSLTRRWVGSCKTVHIKQQKMIITRFLNVSTEICLATKD